MNMKFVKGMIIGGMVSAGAMMVYKEMTGKNKKQMIKKGKQFARKMGILISGESNKDSPNYS